MQWTAMATSVIAEDGELSLQLGRHHCCEALTMVYFLFSLAPLLYMQSLISIRL